ncbi:MAG: putative peptide maturation dehydrogenase, partial [Pseudomonadota bacterium]|nr:putative peptide maturation dehydrogenase [Pseudomonadota bacterium]
MEPREVAHFELADLLAGGTGVVGRLCWFAHAPHLAEPVEIDAAQLPVLGALGSVDWMPRALLDARYGMAAVGALLHSRLLIEESQDDISDLADHAFRAVRWHAPAAVAHIASRWQGEDGPRAMAEAGVDTSAGLVREQGTPPPHVPAPRAQGSDLDLP